MTDTTQRAPENTPLIEVSNLSKAFGNNKVLNGISLTVNKGEFFVIIGGSGTGKSVLIKCILGLLSPDTGEIKVNGVNLLKLSNSERQKILMRFGMLFQGGALFDSMTVAENIAFGLVQGLRHSPIVIVQALFAYRLTYAQYLFSPELRATL